MTDNGHHMGQGSPSYPQANPPAGGDGRVRGYGMGQAGGQAAGLPQPGHPYPYQGQPYGYEGQSYAPQGYQSQQPYGRYPVYPQQAYAMPATSQPVKVKGKRGKGFWVALAIAIICLVAAAVLAFVLLQGGPSNRAGTKGQLEGKTEAEIQAELNRQVDEGMFNISIASVVEFADGASEGELRIENVPGNRYLMKVEIKRDDNGEVVYISDMIEPDYHIQRDTLDVDLPAGTYPCTATFTAYDPETESEVGKAAAKITLQVQS